MMVEALENLKADKMADWDYLYMWDMSSWRNKHVKIWPWKFAWCISAEDTMISIKDAAGSPCLKAFDSDSVVAHDIAEERTR